MQDGRETTLSNPVPIRPSRIRPALILLLLILGVAAALRLVALRQIPPGDWYDEAINGIDALRILREPGWPLFFTTEGHPREPLYMYCVAGSFSIFGPNYVSLRAPSVLIGLLTIFLLWLWAREAAWSAPGGGGSDGSDGGANLRLPLMAALCLALMRWHVHFSRLSFRTILTGLFILIVLWALWRLGRTRRARWAFVAGAALGVGLATYLAFRVVPMLVILIALHAAWRCWRTQRAQNTSDPASSPAAGALAPIAWRGWILAFALGLGVGGFPAFYDAARNPEHLTGRAGEVNPFAKGVAPGLRLLARQARDVALTFFIRGDHVAKHNVPGSPDWAQLYWWRSPGEFEEIAWTVARRGAALGGPPAPDPHGHGLPVFDPVTAMFFAAGMILLLRRAARDTAAFAVLAWIALIGLTSVLSFGAPNYLRMLGMTPAVAYALAEGVDWVRGRIAGQWGARAGAIFLVLFFVHFGAIEAKRYFFDWPRHPATWMEFNTEFAELAREIQRAPADVAFQVPDYIRRHPTFDFETTDRAGIFGFGAEGPGGGVPRAHVKSTSSALFASPASSAASVSSASSSAQSQEVETPATQSWHQVLVVMPVPPYPPAPVSESWLASKKPAQALRRPDGAIWAYLIPGPAE